MKNQPGISWGIDAKVNLVESIDGVFFAIYCEDERSIPEIIREFKVYNPVDYHEMMNTLAFYNYNTCKLCPMVKADIDWTC